MRNLLLPVFEGIEFDSQLSVALDIAHAFKSHIDVMFLRPKPQSTLPPVMVAAGVSAAEIEREGRKAEASAYAHFDAWCRENGVAEQRKDLVEMVATWSERIGALETAIARRGRLSDLVVVNKPGSHGSRTERAFDTAVFETGRPTLVVPRYVPAGILDYPIVAWNGSLEAARVVAGAMPLLHKAMRVSVFSALEEGESTEPDLDLIDCLKWHSINAVLIRPRTVASSIGAELLKTATDQSATLLVMGAYTHRRLRQMLLPGVTRHVLRHGTLPVLMAH
jgi:nucleotide-binding universal stress UspA family protein